MEDQKLYKTILMSAGIIAASVIFSAIIIKTDFSGFNITTRAIATMPGATTTEETTTSVETTTAETTVVTTTVKSTSALCKAPCFGYFEFIDCVDGAMRIKNGGSPVTVSAVRGGIHTIRNDNPSYMPNAIITITNIPTTGNQEIEINYWVDNVLKLDVATIIN